MITRVKGTQDFIDLRLFNFIINTTKKHLAHYNFKEIATPILEPLELFERSLGVQTDVVNKEMFIIKPAHDESDSICLRPEATASTVRAFVQNHIEHTPWKVFSYGPMFRYERPQKGRFRQFHQVTVEVIGSANCSQDVQLIAMLDRLFSRGFGLDTFALHINFLGTPSDRAQFKIVLHAFLEKHQAELCQTCQVRKDTNIMRVFDCKNPVCQELYTQAPHIVDSLCDESKKEWETIQEELSLLSIAYQYVPQLVRGLDYYNKTVFEFVSPVLGAQSTFCGGGRYDTLVSQVGGKQDQPSVGAAFGIERLMIILEKSIDTLSIPLDPALFVVVPFAPEQHTMALLLADTLRAQGLCVDVLVDGSSLKSMMRKVDKMGASYVLLLGSEEQQAGTVVVKNMRNGTQETIKQHELLHFLQK